ncbi:MAG: NAD(+)/NADH kinase [Ardenticatenia bacterium]|nr:NAD(+)/NADH kinase [Ardenticatenia bacterium]
MIMIPAAGGTMQPAVGLIANPASGKDIRRLIAHGSVFDNNEKANIIRRVLQALDAFGVKQVLAMPDLYGLVLRALEDTQVGLRVEFVNISVTNTAADSRLAAAVMAQAGVRCIVTVGGDGTNRVVAQGCGDVPLVPISTGTNNVFPSLVESTLAGMAAAAVACDVEPVWDRAVRQARRLEIVRGNTLVETALVDVVVYDERFVATRAIWDADKMRALFLTAPYRGTIGASAIAAYLPQAEEVARDAAGLYVELGPGGTHVMAPIAPGLIVPVSVRVVHPLELEQTIPVTYAPSILALDGEREVPVPPGTSVGVRLSSHGPYVVDVQAALQAAVKAGFFIRKP